MSGNVDDKSGSPAEQSRLQLSGSQTDLIETRIGALWLLFLRADGRILAFLSGSFGAKKSTEAFERNRNRASEAESAF